MIARPTRAWTAAALMAAAVLFGFSAPAHAHDPGLSSLRVEIGPDRVAATLSMATADARSAVQVSHVSLESFALDSIEVRLDGVLLSGVVDSHVTDESGASVTLAFNRATGSRLTVRSQVAHRLARGHRELLRVQQSGGELLAERMLDAQMDAIDLDLGAGPARTGAAGQFLELGVRHILGGYDHLLFLAALLVGVQRLQSVVKTVTAFTAAHSLTLSAAVLGIVDLPASIVEPLIAASIVIVGIENLRRGHVDSRWKLTFAFGLIHGFGFAGALRDLGVGALGYEVAVPLVSFNTGVEIGQIAVVMLMWPLIRRLNARPALRLRLAPACSLLVVAAGSYWMVERMF